jgi:hypothetical protein
MKWKEEYIMNYEMKCNIKRDSDNLCRSESINNYLSIYLSLTTKHKKLQWKSN